MVAKPHGGKLVDRTRFGRSLERLIDESKSMPKINISEGRAYDVENIAHGVYSPLEGFMGSNDYQTVIKTMRLQNDLPWALPIVLDVNDNEISGIKEGDEVVLSYQNENLAILRIEEIYSWDKKEYAYYVYNTTSREHPGVEKTLSRKDKLISGNVTLIEDIKEPYENVRLWPKDTRVLFDHLNLKSIAAFQTRNAPHTGHEYVIKSALTFVDGVFINPLLGWKKKGDFIDDIIVNAYQALLTNYFPKGSYVFSILRMEMNYAGPKEAIHHAIVRKNFGATHIIIGRDHAGVGNYYGPYDSWKLFQEFPDLGITPLFIREAFYCKKCNSMANEKICPHREEDRIRISGTQIREMILRGEKPPYYIIRPEVYDVISKYKNPFY